jgi:hypothetical protein
MTAQADSEITIRLVGGADRGELVRLAQRDSAPPLSGKALGAWIDGELVAARSLTNGRAVADPFRQTGQVASLLERRAKQMRGERRRRPLPFRRRSRAALPGSPPGAGGRTLVLDEC